MSVPFFVSKKKKEVKEEKDKCILDENDAEMFNNKFNDIRDRDEKEKTLIDTLGIKYHNKEIQKTTVPSPAHPYKESKEEINTIVDKEKKKDIILTSISTNGLLPLETTIPCFYCRRKFISRPLGIPIKYSQREYYTDGIYCSFNCMISEINTSSSYLYKDSFSLIHHLYKDIFGCFPKEKIMSSPNWRLRKEYGGHLSDEEYEKLLQIVEYKDIKQHSLMYHLERIYKIK